MTPRAFASVPRTARSPSSCATLAAGLSCGAITTPVTWRGGFESSLRSGPPNHHHPRARLLRLRLRARLISSLRSGPSPALDCCGSASALADQLAPLGPRPRLHPAAARLRLLGQGPGQSGILCGEQLIKLYDWEDFQVERGRELRTPLDQCGVWVSRNEGERGSSGGAPVPLQRIASGRRPRCGELATNPQDFRHAYADLRRGLDHVQQDLAPTCCKFRGDTKPLFSASAMAVEAVVHATDRGPRGVGRPIGFRLRQSSGAASAYASPAQPRRSRTRRSRSPGSPAAVRTSARLARPPRRRSPLRV